MSFGAIFQKIAKGVADMAGKESAEKIATTLAKNVDNIDAAGMNAAYKSSAIGTFFKKLFGIAGADDVILNRKMAADAAGRLSSTAKAAESAENVVKKGKYVFESNSEAYKKNIEEADKIAKKIDDLKKQKAGLKDKSKINDLQKQIDPLQTQRKKLLQGAENARFASGTLRAARDGETALDEKSLGTVFNKLASGDTNITSSIDDVNSAIGAYRQGLKSLGLDSGTADVGGFLDIAKNQDAMGVLTDMNKFGSGDAWGMSLQSLFQNKSGNITTGSIIKGVARGTAPVWVGGLTYSALKTPERLLGKVTEQQAREGKL